MKRQQLTPLMKLVVLAMQQRPDTPYTICDLAEVTGGSPFSVQKLTQKLTKRGIITRGRDGRVSTFTLTNPFMQVVQ